MQFSGEYHIPAPRERVWAMLNDADVLRQCIPGCESLEADGADAFNAKVTTKVGPVKATFNGAVTLSDLNPPESYKITGEGKGGVAGFAKGGADIHLAEDGADATVLTYTADAQVGGKLAQLGGRLIDSTARKMADQFFGKFSELASGGAEEKPAEAAAPTGILHDAEEAVGEAAHQVAEAAHKAEEELEREAAAGTLGGPIVWALLVLAAIILFYLIVN
ncbi:MAG TPA: carbon monoxide dehydrogenase subunit G [Afifellaceae bacterium]|nr:carbon monoxide dehydrogenase subunit G [Afifellaceae bacterium]